MRRAQLYIALGLAIACDRRPDASHASVQPAAAAAAKQHDLVGTRLPELHFDAWLAAAAATAGASPAPTLYRWWTDSCAYCEASLPAIETLRLRFEPRGLRVVAVYHPKPPRDVAPATIRDAAERFGYHGLIAVDRDWSELTRFYLSTGDRPATSASFLVDREGIIRFVHPGPEIHTSDAAYADLERAIERVLAPRPRG
jgi:hypothetical protein